MFRSGGSGTHRSAKEKYLDRQRDYQAQVRRGDDEFLWILDQIDDFREEELMTKHTKIRVTQWIEKLSEPLSNRQWKKNRNAYARLLLQQLEAGELSEPFIKMPDTGPLPTLPQYLRIHTPKSPTYRCAMSPRRRRQEQHGFSTTVPLESSSNSARKNLFREERDPPRRRTPSHSPSRGRVSSPPPPPPPPPQSGSARKAKYESPKQRKPVTSTRLYESGHSRGRREREEDEEEEQEYVERDYQHAEFTHHATVERLEAALKQIQIQQEQIKILEEELANERALRSKEKHRLRKLHNTELDEMRTIHLKEIAMLKGSYASSRAAGNNYVDYDDDEEDDDEEGQDVLSKTSKQRNRTDSSDLVFDLDGQETLVPETQEEDDNLFTSTVDEDDDDDDDKFLQYLDEFQQKAKRMIQSGSPKKQKK